MLLFQQNLAAAGSGGSASGRLNLSGTAAGDVIDKAHGAGSIALAGAAHGDVIEKGAGSGTLPLTGSGTGVGSVPSDHGAGSGSLQLSGSSAGSVTVNLPGEVVTLDQAKRQCKLEGTATEDEFLADLIKAAREHVEKYTGTRLVQATVDMTFATFEELQWLTEAPVQSITSVIYLDAVTGAQLTLDPSIYEFVNVRADVLRPRIRTAFNQQWPDHRLAEDAVRVTAVVGYTTVPMPLVRAMLLMISQWYDSRQEFQQDRGTFAILPNGVDALLANYRR